MIFILANLAFLIGILFCLSSIIGVFRMPDYYCRCHASGITETLGLMFPCIGLILVSGFSNLSLKLILLFIILFLNNPVSSHAIGRSAYISHYPIWTKEEKDDAKSHR